MTPETTIVGLLLAGMSVMASVVVFIFKTYHAGVTDRIQTIKDACLAKDADIAWLRTQLAGWTGIAQEQIRVNETLADKAAR